MKNNQSFKVTLKNGKLIFTVSKKVNSGITVIKEYNYFLNIGGF